jgi:hypothetical protein
MFLEKYRALELFLMNLMLSNCTRDTTSEPTEHNRHSNTNSSFGPCVRWSLHILKLLSVPNQHQSRQLLYAPNDL